MRTRRAIPSELAIGSIMVLGLLTMALPASAEIAFTIAKCIFCAPRVSRKLVNITPPVRLPWMVADTPSSVEIRRLRRLSPAGGRSSSSLCRC